MLDDFAAKNHEVFDPTADENKLEYTVLHQQYQQMLEAHIEGKLVDAAVDLGGFLAALHRQRDRPPERRRHVPPHDVRLHELPFPVVRVERDVERLDDPQRDQDGDVLPEADGAVSVD